MSCGKYEGRTVHLLLAQEDPELVAEFARHRRECERCNAEASELERLLRLVKSVAEQPASQSFRARLARRLGKERRLEDEQLLNEAGFFDRVVSLAAYTRFRVASSPGLRVLLTAAAIHLLAFLVFLSWSSSRQAEQIGIRDTAQQVEEGQPGPDTAKEAEADPFERESLVALESLSPPRAKDVYIEPPASPLPVPEPLEETLLVELFQEAKAQTSRENLLVKARFRMRHRFSRWGDRPVDRAVLRSLRFLAGSQEQDGSWDPVGFNGEPEARVGMTGMCVLAFLVNAERGIPGGLYRQHVDRGLDYLRSSVTADRTIGAVRGDEDVVLFNHAVATLAFAEHYLLSPGSDTELLADALERLEDLGARRKFRERQSADNITAPWVALALETARASGVPAVIDLDRAAADAQSFVAQLVDIDPVSGLALTPGDQLCAIACASALDPLFDDVRDAGRYEPPPDLLLQHLREESLREPTKIFFAALDLLGRGGVAWNRWEEAATKELLATQNEDGSWTQTFAWDPVGSMGGDLYETALGVMILSVGERIAR